MSDADKAFAAARKLIAETKVSAAKELSFDDEKFRALAELPIEISELTGLTTLSLANTEVADVTPLAGLTGLTRLSLANTRVADVTPLARLTGLTTLWLHNTAVADVTPLAGLTGLTDLWLANTKVADVTPLAGLTGLTELSLTDTPVMDVTPLASLKNLNYLWLYGTQVANVTVLAGLTGLTYLSLSNTTVADVTPLAALTGLTELSLANTQVADLRPIKELVNLIPSQERIDLRLLEGLKFKGCAATRLDPEGLGRLAEIEDDEQRTRETLAYLQELKEWPPKGVVEPDSFIPVFISDGRLEIAASTPSEVERDERLKQALHDRLKAKTPELAQAAGNRFPRMAIRARALHALVDRPFNELDLLLIHLEVEDLSDSLKRRADREGEEEYTPDVIDALSDVVRIGPGLTLGNDQVETLLDRQRRFAGEPPPAADKAAHDGLSAAIAGDTAAMGDNLRSLEAEVVRRPDAASSGAIQQAAHRSIIWRLATSGALMAAAYAGGVSQGIVGDVVGPAVIDFVASNFAAVSKVAATYGAPYLEYFLMSARQIPALAGLAASIEMRPIDRTKKLK